MEPWEAMHKTLDAVDKLMNQTPIEECYGCDKAFHMRLENILGKKFCIECAKEIHDNLQETDKEQPANDIAREVTDYIMATFVLSPKDTDKIMKEDCYHIYIWRAVYSIIIDYFNDVQLRQN